MTKRKTVDPEIISKLKDERWLRQKLINEQYSCSRLAKELGTTRTTVEKYRVSHKIEQPLSQKELATIAAQSRTEQEKQSIIDKRCQTNLKRHGVENPFQSVEKIEESMLKKYGVRKPLQHERFREKRYQTNIEKFGVKHPIQNKEIQESVRQHFEEKYGGNPGKHNVIREKMKQTSLERYGVEHASQKHLSQSTLNKLSNRTWLIEHHHNKQKTLSQIANELECNITTVYRHCVNHDIEIKHYFESAQQRELSDWLTSIGIKVETNVRNIISGELDIYLPDYNLAIEYCGVFWHSDAHSRITPNYHLNKMKQCNQKGIRLITMYEDEWLYTKEIVKQKILAIVGKLNSSVAYARKCSVVEVSKQTKKTFFNSNHIQGDGPGSITYGLEYNDEIVAMMTFIRQQNGIYVLNRYASSYRVIGGFQKLLKHFQKNHEWKQIVSFADLRWSEGDVYYKGGFTLDKTLKPDYRYVIGNKTFHKFGFRRKSLPTILGKKFNPELSEMENMKNAGYHKIWNCGLMRFVLDK